VLPFMSDPRTASRQRITGLYFEAVQEFNDSAYARESGYRVQPLPAHHVTEAMEVAALLPSGGVFLDVGTGYGLVPRILQRLGARVISTDFPTTGGKGPLQRLMDLGIEGHYVQVGAEPLPLPDESVDVVFVGNVIEHLPHSPRPFMADVKRVLKSGGHLVMDTKNAVDLKTRLKMLLGLSNWPPLESIFPLDFNPHHHKEYTLAELRRLLELAGFRNVRGYAFETHFHRSLKKLGKLQAMGAAQSEVSQYGTGFNFRHPYEYARLVALLLTRLFPNLRDSILVVGRK
jgi:SAM-dependent methyltransferase